MTDLERLDKPIRDALLEAIPCAVVVLNAEGRIVLWNAMAERLTGFGAEEVRGSTCEVVHMQLSTEQDPALLRALCPISGDRATEPQELHIRRKDGQRVPVVRRATRVRDGAGQTLATIQTLVDARPMKSAREEIRTLRQEIARSGRFGELVGSSEPMRRLYEAIEQVGPTDAAVVIEGETGTGKELVARTLHQRSPRREGLFLPVNCGALPETLIEAELFGHTRGAFTGASSDRAGRFEEADRGTLLLDEVAELPAAAQVKLLRAIQEGEVTRVGESRPRKVDVRIIAAANRPLRQRVREGRFREDLYYRLRVVGLEIPPLRERKEDIPDLVVHFLGRLNARYNREVEGLEAEAMDRLEGHDWPGNVRELEHALEHAFIVTPPGKRIIALGALPPEIRRASASRPTDAEPPAGAPEPGPAIPKPRGVWAQRAEVLNALQETGGNKAAAARKLGITRAGLYKRLRRLGIQQ